MRSGDRRLKSRAGLVQGRETQKLYREKAYHMGLDLFSRRRKSGGVDVQMVHFGVSRALIRGLSRDLART